ncbi:MAG: hypothetical protein IPM35_41275 [Myxococcales bacterium]|nr:hypothetical protein [Myxococcales bacterium]
MAKRPNNSKPKKRRPTFASAISNTPIASKVIAELKRYGAEKSNVIDFQAVKAVRVEVERMNDDDGAASESDPACAYYLQGIKLLTLIGNSLAHHPALSKLMDKIEAAEQEYGPSGPPMSPITHSHFITWSLLDLPQGIGRETVGSVAEASHRAIAGDAAQADLMAVLNKSRLGVFVQETKSVGNRLRLRELVTGDVGEYACDSGYRGEPGNILLVRTLPPPANILGHGAIIMTPYQIIAPGEDAWLAYFDRTLPLLGIADRAKAYEQLMKWGLGKLGERYWMEYIFEGYANHSESTVFLKGLPDVASSRPHAEKTSPLSMQAGA